MLGVCDKKDIHVKNEICGATREQQKVVGFFFQTLYHLLVVMYQGAQVGLTL